MDMRQKLVSWLFETDALRVCPEKKPFFYTSGTVGPYYINTHFLYGGEAAAAGLLSRIDGYLENPAGLSEKVARETLENYQKGGVYHELMEGIAATIRRDIGTGEIDYISGGERRDWFFSFEAARLLGKPHITLFKDNSMQVYNPSGAPEPSLDGARVLHISDLITEASSYIRAWIPALEALGARMLWSLSVVDRMQGGAGLLASRGVKQISLIEVERPLFEQALGLGRITGDQYDMIIGYVADPVAAMTEFLKSSPEFLQNALNGDERTRARAKLLIESGVYKL